MTISVERIVELHAERRKNRTRIVNAAQDIRDAYNGDYALPLPELNRNERAAVANLIQLGVDQTAMRIANSPYSLFAPPERPGIHKSEDEAAARRKAGYGWWQANELDIKDARRARHLTAYSSSPVVIRPWKKMGIPRWQVRDPLATFAAPMADPDDMEPENVIFSMRRSLSWLRANYPDQAVMVYKGRDPKPDDLFDLLEYMDADEHVLCVTGKNRDRYDVGDSIYGVENVVELERFANRIGICPAVVPGRVTLDRPLGQFDGALPIFVKEARLAALEEIAIERGVFPEQWLVADQAGGNAVISVMADPIRGIVGEVSGGKIDTVQLAPGYKTDGAIDRYERAMRVEGGIPADFGGESASNVRTDRRGQSIMSATVDHRIAEAQKVFARSKEKELSRAYRLAKAMYGSTRKSFWVSWKGAVGPADYTPDKDFTTDVVFVRYSMPGTDVNGIAIAGGQRVGLGTLSPRTFMEMDPMVDDPDLEQDRVVYAQLQEAVLTGFKQQAAAGAIPISDAARVMELVVTHKMPVQEAIAQAQKEAQERQSSTVQPVEPGSPESQPGLAQPGMGAEAGTAPPPAVNPTQDIARRLRSLHQAGTVPTGTEVQVA